MTVDHSGSRCISILSRCEFVHYPDEDELSTRDEFILPPDRYQFHQYLAASREVKPCLVWLPLFLFFGFGVLGFVWCLGLPVLVGRFTSFFYCLR